MPVTIVELPVVCEALWTWTLWVWAKLLSANTERVLQMIIHGDISFYEWKTTTHYQDFIRNMVIQLATRWESIDHV